MKNGTAVLIILLALVVFLVAGFSVKVPIRQMLFMKRKNPML